MAGRRGLPSNWEDRTPAQKIESGWKLDGQQKQIYELWDKQILLLKLKGRTSAEISAEVGCSEVHVRKRLPRLLAEQAKQFSELAGLEIVTQLASLDMLLSEVMQQWERSCKDREETVSETEGGGNYKEAGGSLESVPDGKFRQKSRTTRAGQTGDPRLVEQIRAIMADKRRLLRLDKDDTLSHVLSEVNFTQVNVNAGEGAMVPITAMTPQALAELTELLGGLGMNPDGTPMQKRLPEPQEVIEEVIEAELVEAASA